MSVDEDKAQLERIRKRLRLNRIGYFFAIACNGSMIVASVAILDAQWIVLLNFAAVGLCLDGLQELNRVLAQVNATLRWLERIRPFI